MANLSKPIIAAFDFDGTLTYGDSLLPFLSYVSGKTAAGINTFFEIPHLLQYVLGSMDRQGLKEAFLTRFLKGKTRDEISTLGEQFAKEIIPGMVRPEGLQRIAWHKMQGHRCLLVSANLDSYLLPWGRLAGIDDIISSRVEFSSNGFVTGHLQGLNCRGAEKVRRLTEILGPKSEYILYAYGDSAGDRELLAFADYPFYRKFS
jgi:phosphatidylglycerophosphatase C